MDIETIDAAGIRPIQADLEMIAAIETTEDLVSAMAELIRRGVTAPLGFYVYPDLKNSSSYAVYFGQNGITMPNRDYYIETGNENFTVAREALPGYISSLLTVAGAEDADIAAQLVYDLEDAIFDQAVIALANHAGGDSQTLGDLRKWFSAIFI